MINFELKHQFICLIISPSILLSIPPFIYMSIYLLSIHLSVHSLIIHSSICPFTQCQFIYLSIHSMSIHPSVHSLIIHSSICTFTCHPFIYLYNYFSSSIFNYIYVTTCSQILDILCVCTNHLNHSKFTIKTAICILFFLFYLLERDNANIYFKSIHYT